MRKFEVLYPSYHGKEWENCQPIKAYDHEDAAERWAEYDDQDGDYSIISSGESETIYVREEGQSTIKKFKVFANAIPNYSATELKDGAP